MSATQLRRRKESLLGIVKMASESHPMEQSYNAVRKGVNMLLQYLWLLEFLWPKTHLMTSSLSSILDQLVRSATSVSANMMEGYGKGTRESLDVFLRIARGSLCETSDHLVTLGIIIESEPTLKALTTKHNEVVCSWANAGDLFETEFLSHFETSVQIVVDTLNHESSITASKKRKCFDVCVDDVNEV
jgi:four helix bundle protein